MSALPRVRVPLAAFLAAALGGVGLGLVLQSGDEPRRAARAGVGPAVTTQLPTQQIPATPVLRLGTSPAAGPVSVTPVSPQVGSQNAQPEPTRPQPGSGGTGLSVTEQPVDSR